MSGPFPDSHLESRARPARRRVFLLLACLFFSYLLLLQSGVVEPPGGWSWNHEPEGTTRPTGAQAVSVPLPDGSDPGSGFLPTTPEEEMAVLFQAAQNLDWENQRFVLTVIALCRQPPPVGLSPFQRQRFLSELSSHSHGISLDEVTAHLLGELILTQQLDEAVSRLGRRTLPGSPQNRLELLVRVLTEAAGDADPGRANDRLKKQIFQSLDEAVTSILLLYDQGMGNYLGRANAAAALRILHPVLVAGSPPLLPAQEAWIRQNLTREALDPETILDQASVPYSERKNLATLHQELARYLHGTKGVYSGSPR